jgi:hypothetical protein
MNGFGEAAGAAFAAQMPLVLGAAGSGGSGGGGGCALTELFLNTNAFGAGALQLFAEHLQAASASGGANEEEEQERKEGGGEAAAADDSSSAAATKVRRRRMALLNLQDNGLSQPEAEVGPLPFDLEQFLVSLRKVDDLRRQARDGRKECSSKKTRLCVKQEMMGDAGCVETLLL